MPCSLRPDGSTVRVEAKLIPLTKIPPAFDYFLPNCLSNTSTLK